MLYPAGAFDASQCLVTVEKSEGQSVGNSYPSPFPHRRGTFRYVQKHKVVIVKADLRVQSSVISPQYVFYKPWEARGGGKDGGGSAPPPPGGYPGFPYIMFGDGLQAVKVRPTRSPSSTTTICSGHASFQDSPFFFRAYAIDRLPIDAHFDFALLHAYVSVLHESPRGLSSRFRESVRESVSGSVPVPVQSREK